jgi:hypothetical protein
MRFTPNILRNIMNVIDYNHIVFSLQTVGKKPLTKEDIALLKRFGVNPDELLKKYPSIFKSFHWGRLSAILRDKAAQINYNDFMTYLQKGQYIPLSKQEETVLEYVENKSYSHIKGLGERIKQTVSGVMIENDPDLRAAYEDVIKDSIKTGVIERQSVSQVVSAIGHATGDWERDLGRIAETEMNTAFQHGRAEMIKREQGVEAQVFKQTFPLACKHCIRLHLTAGIGSKPIVFTLKELIDNGTNIGKKVDEWLPVIGSVHPWCRCEIRDIPKGYVWNEEEKRFAPPEFIEDKYGVKGTIKVTVGDKIIMV